MIYNNLQVSLWGGDAVFSNLDLRLDVLEQELALPFSFVNGHILSSWMCPLTKELALPFSFVNGHIHELRIHVPWTKLTSESVVITINTIGKITVEHLRNLL